MANLGIRSMWHPLEFSGTEHIATCELDGLLSYSHVMMSGFVNALENLTMESKAPWKWSTSLEEQDTTWNITPLKRTSSKTVLRGPKSMRSSIQSDNVPISKGLWLCEPWKASPWNRLRSDAAIVKTKTSCTLYANTWSYFTRKNKVMLNWNSESTTTKMEWFGLPGQSFDFGPPRQEGSRLQHKLVHTSS